MPGLTSGSIFVLWLTGSAFFNSSVCVVRTTATCGSKRQSLLSSTTLSLAVLAYSGATGTFLVLSMITALATPPELVEQQPFVVQLVLAADLLVLGGHDFVGLRRLAARPRRGP